MADLDTMPRHVYVNDGPAVWCGAQFGDRQAVRSKIWAGQMKAPADESEVEDGIVSIELCDLCVEALQAVRS